MRSAQDTKTCLKNGLQYVTANEESNMIDFPKRLPEKLKTIREQLGLTPDEIAPKVGAKTGAEIVAYENDEDDLLVSVL